jgi:hypothetical protein
VAAVPGRGTASGLAKRLPSGAASTPDASPPVVPDTGPRRPSRHHHCRVCTWHRPHRFVQTPPPNRAAAGSDGRRVLSRVGAGDHLVTPQVLRTGFAWREHSYGGFGGGHSPFRLHTFCRQRCFSKLGYHLGNLRHPGCCVA